MRSRALVVLWIVVGCSSPGAFPDAGPLVADTGVREDGALTVEDAAPTFEDARPVGEDAMVGEDAPPPPEDATPAEDALAPGEDARPAPDAAPDAMVAPDAAPRDAEVAADAGLGLDCTRQPGINPNAGMTYFVTSVGTGAAGGNLGGLAGADARCACLAARVGAGGRTWRAYLSTTTPLVHARDRLGAGPWVNFNGVTVAASRAALLADGINGSLSLTETGQRVPDMEHDILTGTNADGTAHESYDCGGWTDGTDTGFAWVGHPDWNLPNGSGSWASSHECFCSPAGLRATWGAGRLYCFAD